MADKPEAKSDGKMDLPSNWKELACVYYGDWFDSLLPDIQERMAEQMLLQQWERRQREEELQRKEEENQRKDKRRRQENKRLRQEAERLRLKDERLRKQEEYRRQEDEERQHARMVSLGKAFAAVTADDVIRELSQSGASADDDRVLTRVRSGIRERDAWASAGVRRGSGPEDSGIRFIVEGGEGDSDSDSDSIDHGDGVTVPDGRQVEQVCQAVLCQLQRRGVVPPRPGQPENSAVHLHLFSILEAILQDLDRRGIRHHRVDHEYDTMDSRRGRPDFTFSLWHEDRCGPYTTMAIVEAKRVGGTEQEKLRYLGQSVAQILHRMSLQLLDTDFLLNSSRGVATDGDIFRFVDVEIAANLGETHQQGSEQSAVTVRLSPLSHQRRRQARAEILTPSADTMCTVRISRERRLRFDSDDRESLPVLRRLVRLLMDLPEPDDIRCLGSRLPRKVSTRFAVGRALGASPFGNVFEVTEVATPSRPGYSNDGVAACKVPYDPQDRRKLEIEHQCLLHLASRDCVGVPKESRAILPSRPPPAPRPEGLTVSDTDSDSESHRDGDSLTESDSAREPLALITRPAGESLALFLSQPQQKAWLEGRTRSSMRNRLNFAMEMAVQIDATLQSVHNLNTEPGAASGGGTQTRTVTVHGDIHPRNVAVVERNRSDGDSATAAQAAATNRTPGSAHWQFILSGWGLYSHTRQRHMWTAARLARMSGHSNTSRAHYQWPPQPCDDYEQLAMLVLHVALYHRDSDPRRAPWQTVEISWVERTGTLKKRVDWFRDNSNDIGRIRKALCGRGLERVAKALDRIEKDDEDALRQLELNSESPAAASEAATDTGSGRLRRVRSSLRKTASPRNP